jgi:VWFA-related protein
MLETMTLPSRALLVALLVSATFHGQSPSAQTPTAPPASAPNAPARQPPAPRTQEAEATEVTAIVVDVIVRDRGGNPVRGLTGDDFEIYEDNVRQTIGSFTPISAAEPGPSPRLNPASTGATTTPAAGSGTPPAQARPQVIALVFDRLSGEARALAQKAALAYVGPGKLADNVIAIFGVDLSLSLIQPFTREGDLIRQGLETAGGRATSQFADTRAEQNAMAAAAARANAVAGSVGAGGPGTQGPNAGAMGDAQFASMQARALESFRALERDQQGYATSNSLLAIVSALKAIPGRKSLVFFSEGLSIPPNVQSQFVSVIDAANRANVSIYPMDAAGLRTQSLLKETREGVNSGRELELARDPTRDPTGRPMTMGLEDNEALLRADPHSGLGTLADETGGFLIAQTNDLRGGFSAIDTDMRNYYALTYTPSNTRFDGRFRRIEVKVKRSDVRVRSRRGYFAVRPTMGAPLLAYEAPALTVLEQSPVPNAFPARALTLRFPERSRPGLVPVLVNVPTAGITFRPSEDKKSYTSDFVVLVRFRDESGVTIEKMSQRYQLQGPLDQMPRAAQGDVLFYREPVLGVGVFSMEAAVYDALSGKASVRLATVEVPESAPEALAMSSVVAIKRAEKVPENERGDGPLFVGGQLLYPNMGEPVSRELPFYFIVYPAVGAGEPRATLELFGSGQQLAKAPLELAKPDAAGRIRQVSRIPLEALKPGSYELRVTVEQGSQRTSRQLAFRIAS